MHFYQIFGLSKLVTGQENGSQVDNAGQEFGSQNLGEGPKKTTKFWTYVQIVGRYRVSKKNRPTLVLLNFSG